MSTSVSGHIIDCSGSIWGIYADKIVSCACELIDICSLYLAFEGILVFGMYMSKACFLLHDVDGAINDTIAFAILGWLFRGIIWLLGVSTSTSYGINVMCHLWCHWHHVLLMLMPMVSHDQKVMLHITLIILTYVMPMPMASLDEKVMLHLIVIAWPKEFNGTIYDIFCIKRHWCQWHHRMKYSCCTQFWSSWPKEFNCTIYDSISITWCQSQLLYMTKKA